MWIEDGEGRGGGDEEEEKQCNTNTSPTVRVSDAHTLFLCVMNDSYPGVLGL